ncbi:MAG: magnesium transporter [Clostridia bacterium]|nr:magnesium transporter [Clostridia bacterium]
MKDTTFAISETIAVLLAEKKYRSLRDILTTMRAADIAIMFDGISETKLPLLFRLLPKELAAETFVEMESDSQELLIRSFSDAELKAVVSELFVDDAVAIVEEMPANVVKRILLQADPEMRKMINEILNYPDESAGSVMTTEYVTLRPQMTVEAAIKRIRRTGTDKETIYTCYVTNDARVLIGYVSLKSLILAEEDERIEDIMGTDIISVKTFDDQEDVAAVFLKYDLSALPVVDNEGRIVGIVTVDDAIDILEEEATEDIEKMAAITPSDKPYMKMSALEICKSRFPWLLLLMVSATFTGMIITSFEHALAAQVALAAFIPMLMDSAGNTGSQASATVIRALSLGELVFTDLVKVVWKEIRIAVYCGLALAVACFAKVLVIDMWILQIENVTATVALVVSVTLALTILCAKIIGSAMPLLAKKVGFDPAVMSAPLITTIADAISLMIYFRIATAVLHI